MTIERRFFTPPLGEVIAKADSAEPIEIFSANKDKDAKIDLALERLDQGVEQFLDDPSSYFRVMAKFHKHSLANTLMIFTATRRHPCRGLSTMAGEVRAPGREAPG